MQYNEIPPGHWRTKGQIVPIKEMDDFHIFSAMTYLEGIFPRYKELVAELASRRIKSIKVTFNKRRKRAKKIR